MCSRLGHRLPSVFQTIYRFLQTPAVRPQILFRYGTSASPLSLPGKDNGVTEPPNVEKPEPSTGRSAPSSSSSEKQNDQPKPSKPLNDRSAFRLPANPPGTTRVLSDRSRLQVLLALRSIRNPYIYGAEISPGESLFRKDHLSSNTFAHQDMVCVACRSTLRSSQVSPSFALFLP